jgi:hypothetical protein
MYSAVLLQRWLFEPQVERAAMAVRASVNVPLTNELYQWSQQLVLQVYEAFSYYLYHHLSGTMGANDIDYLMRTYLIDPDTLDPSRKSDLYAYLQRTFAEAADNLLPYLKVPVENHMLQLMELEEVRFEFTGDPTFAVVVMEFSPVGEAIGMGFHNTPRFLPAPVRGPLQ